MLFLHTAVINPFHALGIQFGYLLLTVFSTKNFLPTDKMAHQNILLQKKEKKDAFPSLIGILLPGIKIFFLVHVSLQTEHNYICLTQVWINITNLACRPSTGLPLYCTDPSGHHCLTAY